MIFWLLFIHIFVVAAPLLMSSFYGAGAGLVVALTCFPIWSKLGPPPGPGFIVGTLCVGGYGLISLVTLLMLVSWLHAFLQ